MPPTRPLLLSFILACAASHPATVRAQIASDSACSYSHCALRVEQRFLGMRLVRGSTGESVARLGEFGSGVGVLLAGPDSAAYHARRYRSQRRTLDALGYTSVALLLLRVATTDDFVDSRTLVVGAVTLNLIALPFVMRSRRSLERAIWWYNRDLRRP
jgi:hypothetical protein